jgi:hypothetical protein
VTGAFTALIPGPCEHAVASVYAEFVHARGWLHVDRALTAAEYAAISAETSTWATQDRALSDVLDAFGPPSVIFGGNNQLYGKTLSYLTRSAGDPIISFHLWNGIDPDAEQTWPPALKEPILLAIRHGIGQFNRSFIFIPRGQLRDCN